MSLDGYTSVDGHLGSFLTMVKGVHVYRNLKQLTGSGGWSKQTVGSDIYWVQGFLWG
jgi:hypothetical protein